MCPKFFKSLSAACTAALVVANVICNTSAFAEDRPAYSFVLGNQIAIRGSAAGEITSQKIAYYPKTATEPAQIEFELKIKATSGGFGGIFGGGGLGGDKYANAMLAVVNLGPMPTPHTAGVVLMDCSADSTTLNAKVTCSQQWADFVGPWANSSLKQILSMQSNFIGPDHVNELAMIHDAWTYRDSVNKLVTFYFRIETTAIDQAITPYYYGFDNKTSGNWTHVYQNFKPTYANVGPFGGIFQVLTSASYDQESFLDVVTKTSKDCPKKNSCPDCGITPTDGADSCKNCFPDIVKEIADQCGVCGGDNSTCCLPPKVPDSSNPPLCCLPAAKGCDGICNSGKVPDCAGVCGGNGHLDQCDVCNGTDECLDCAGVPDGESVRDKDGACCLPEDLKCNKCFGSDNCNSTPTPTPSNTPTPTPTPKCPPPGKFDICGVCNGDGSSCCEEQSFTKEQLEVDGLLHEVSWLGMHLLNRLEVSFKLDGKLSVDEKQTLVGFRRDLIEERNNGWKVVWTEFASVQNICTEEATCVRISNAEALGEITASGDRELAIVEKILKRQRKVRGKKREDDTKIYKAAKGKNDKIKSLVSVLPKSSCP